MAIQFLNTVNLNNIPSEGFALENLAADPGAVSQEGSLYYNTATDVVKVYTGAGWVEVGGGVTDLTVASGTYISLTDASAATGSVDLGTVDISAVDGAAGAGERYLTKSNTWALVSTIPGTYSFDISDGSTTDTISSGDTVQFVGNNGITTTVNPTPLGPDYVRIQHDSISRSDTTSTDAPGYGGTFEAVTSVTSNAQGHITAIDVSTVTIPASDNTDNYVDSVSFNTSTGVLTLGRTGALADLTEDLDGRYLELGGGTMTGEINMGSNKITSLLDPTNAQDAATKAYVDNLVDGGLTFKDGFNANTGAIDGGGNLTSGATRVAISVGDYYVVTTAGDFYGDSSIPLTVGDSVICKTDAAQGASTSANWVIVQGDEGVIDLTSGNGGTSTGNALTSNTNARGAVTVNSFAYDGGSNVGHVPSGGSASTFLRGDGTFATPTNTTYTADQGVDLNGTIFRADLISYTAQTVAANTASTTASRTYPIQINSSDKLVVNVPWTDTTGAVTSVDETTPGTSSGTPIVVNPTTGNVLVKSMAYDGGSNIGHVPSGGSATTFLRGDGTWVTPTDTGALGKRIVLNSGLAYVAKADAGGIRTFTVDVSNASVFGSGAVALDVKCEVITAAGQTVHADVTRSSADLDIAFTGTPADSAYQVLLTYVG